MTDDVKALAERLLSEGAITLDDEVYCNCEDTDEGAVIPIPVKLRDDILAALRLASQREDVGQTRIADGGQCNEHQPHAPSMESK